MPTTREWVRQAPGLVALLDASMRCRALSAGWRRRLGLDADEPLDLPADELLHLDNDPGLVAELKTLRQGGEALRIRTSNTRTCAGCPMRT